MKKIILIILVICTILIVGFVGFNVIPNINNTLDSDGLEINTSYINNSDDLVSDIGFKGSLLTKKTLRIKTILMPKNTLSIENSYSDGEIQLVITDKNGVRVLSKLVLGNEELSFESELGEGIIELHLNVGDHEAFIVINGEKQND